MKNINFNDKQKVYEPILDFISGRMNTQSAKRVTRKIPSLQSLWLLAKMAGNIKKASNT